MCSPCVFFKDGLMLYSFLKPKVKSKNFSLKTQIGNAWNLDFHGVKMAIMHFVAQFTHVSRPFWVYNKKK